jgi:group I intron endonuclease
LNCCDRNVGYNKAKVAGSQLGFKHSKESIKKMSDSWYKNEVANKIHLEKLRLLNIGRVCSDENKLKKSKALLGIKRSDETKAKLSKIFKGRVISEETRIKISNSKKGSASTKRLEVYQLDLDGNEIRKWDFCGDAEKELGISRGKISAVCLGNRKQTGGYKWKYVNK